MNDPARPCGAEMRSEAWARHVRVDIVNIRGRLDIELASDPPHWQSRASREAVRRAIERHLDDVETAIGCRSWLSPFDWWRGTSVEQAFRSMHAARTFLVEIISDDEVKALIPDAVARVESCLFPTDPRRIEVERLPQHTDRALRRAELKHALDMGFAASDESHARLRTFRNVLLATAALIAFFMVGFVAFVSLDPTAIPLCFHPDAPAVVVTQQPLGPIGDVAHRDVCPSGEQVAGGSRRPAIADDVWIVAGLGLLGGALASAVSIRKVTGTTTPYSIPTALALLKVPSGALTAVAGMIFLGGGFVPGLSNLDSQSQILAYALVLGYAQQVATQYIDRKALALVNQIPSKHSEKMPTKSVPSETRGSATHHSSTPNRQELAAQSRVTSSGLVAD